MRTWPAWGRNATGGKNVPTAGRFSLYKGKSSEIWPVHNSEHLVEVCLNNYRLHLLYVCIYFHQWILLSIIRKIFKKIFLYTILLQGISTILTDQMPICLFFQKGTFYAGIKLFNTLPPSVTIFKHGKAKFRPAFSKYLHTHCFFSVDEFVMRKDVL